MRNDIQRALSGAPVAAPMLGAAYAGARRPTGAPTQVAGRTSAIPPYMYGPEDGGPGGPPQRHRQAWPWVVVAVVVVILIAAIAAIKYINGGNSGVAVPAVNGETVAGAKSTLVNAGFVVSGVDLRASSNVTKGLVIGTSPSQGSNEPKGTSVTIFESAGTASHLVSVPDVTTLTKHAAISKLEAAGFTVHVVTGTSAGTPPNTVFSQNPPGNTLVKKGATVTIDVTAKEPIVPASVIGMTQAQAMNLLQNSPYNYMVTPTPGPGNGNGGQPGTVYATSPPTGSPLPQGSAITIFVVQSASSSPTTSSSTSPSVSPSPTGSPTPGQGQPGQGTHGPGASGPLGGLLGKQQ
jgi:serine/threonine-protein kinase